MSNYYLNLSETYVDQNYNDFEYPKGSNQLQSLSKDFIWFFEKFFKYLDFIGIERYFDLVQPV